MKTTASFKIISLAIVLYILLPGILFAQTRTYTLDEHFDEGIYVGVQHNTVPNQLQLDADKTVPNPYVWIPNQDGTISRLDAETGRELSRHKLHPVLPPFYQATNYGLPSRMVVDKYGSCYIGLRTAGTVVKIVLPDSGLAVDYNGNGQVDTSLDFDSDGQVNKTTEMLPWGMDDCVVREISIVDGFEGSYLPGTYTGEYDVRDTVGGACPCSLALDADNNVWIGSFGYHKFYKYDYLRDKIVTTVDVGSHTSYGSYMDSNGVLWSAGRNGNDIMALNTNEANPGYQTIDVGHLVAGIAPGANGKIYVTGYSEDKLSRVDIATGNVDWTISPAYLSWPRGVIVTPDGDLWVANSSANTFVRLNPDDGSLIASVGGPSEFAELNGIGIDYNGKLWVCNRQDSNVFRVDPATNSIDITKLISSSRGHYCYSNLAGGATRTITTLGGSWSVVYDSEKPLARWDHVAWNNKPDDPDSGVYDGTSLIVSVSSSDDMSAWSASETAGNGARLQYTPPGRYLRVVVKFAREIGRTSPILYDLTASAIPQNREFDLEQAYSGNSGGTVRAFMGHKGMGDDVITAVPGILAISPGAAGNGKVNWSNFVTAADFNVPYTLTSVLMKMEAPLSLECPDKYPGKVINMLGTNSIRRWWPIMYTLPGTKWTLTLNYRTAAPWDSDGPGTRQPSLVHQDVWTWKVTASLNSLRGILDLFQELPLGMSQVPLISDEVLLSVLRSQIDKIEIMLQNGDTASASEELTLFMLNVEDACIAVAPRTPIMTGPGTGIANTCDNPACCKILADAEYIGWALNIMQD